MSDNATVDMTVSEYLHGLVGDSNDIEAFLNALTRLAVNRLSGTDEDVLCGITLLRNKRVGTVASSSERAQLMDEIQYDYAGGPCLNASRTQNTVIAQDLTEDLRWPPAYVQRLSEDGIRSVLAVPFRLESGDAAALNLYSERTGAFDTEAVAVVEEYAHQASGALALSLRLARHRDTEVDMAAAMETRTTIDLAVGIIMGQNRCSQDEAFNILRSASNTRNIKLREIAVDLINAINAAGTHTHFDH